MKKITRINTMKDCIQRLHYIYYNFFSTDLLMHKQGVVYEMEGYQKKMIKRLKVFFYKVKKIMKNCNKQDMIKIIQEKENVFYAKVDKERDLVVEYSPEQITAVRIAVKEIMLFGRIRAMLAEEINAEKNCNKLFELEIHLLKKSHRGYRKALNDYGYIPKKEKNYKVLKIALNSIKETRYRLILIKKVYKENLDFRIRT